MLLASRVSAAHWAASGAPRIVIVETIGYVISWVAFPLLMLPLSRWLGREDRFLAFMVAYNWSQLPQTALFVILAANSAAGLLPHALAQFADFAAAVAVLLYEWYIERVERLDRRLRLAQRVAEGREIVMADEVPRALLHRCQIERRRDMPHPAAFQGRRCAPVEYTVKIMPAARRQPRVETGQRRFN